MTTYFSPLLRRADVLAPFITTGTLGAFDVYATVRGGGQTGVAFWRLVFGSIMIERMVVSTLAGIAQSSVMKHHHLPSRKSFFVALQGRHRRCGTASPGRCSCSSRSTGQRSRSVWRCLVAFLFSCAPCLFETPE